jgi:hypothetical protein
MERRRMERKKLLNALIAVKPGVANKEIVESMTYFYFSGSHVISYNDIISIQYPLDTEFSTFVKADDLFKFISKVKSEQLQFDLEEPVLKIKAKKVQSSFATIEDNDIAKRVAVIKKSVEKCTFKSLPEDFETAVKLCSFVASRNESDQTLTCISIKGENVYSTDNVRLSHSVMKSKMPDMLLKASEIKSLLEVYPTKYSVTDAWIHFKSADDCVFSIRRVKGEFPDLSKFMKFKGVDIKLPSSILDGLDLAAIFMDSTEPSVQISLKRGMCRIFKDGEGGTVDYREKLSYTGKPVEFNINPEFLKEMLAYTTDITVSDDKAKLHSGSFTMVTALYG